MKSIGVWYKVVGENIPQLEIHINLWNIKNNKKGIVPFIDLGVSIPDFRKIETLDILLPFSVEKDEINDLYEFVKKPDIARLIFNEIECETSSKDRYAVIRSDNFNDPKLLISIKCGEEFESYIRYKNIEKMTILSVDFEELKKLANRNKWLKTVEECHVNLPSKMILARYFYVITEMRVSSITG